MKLDPKIGRSLKKASPTILTCIGAVGVVATAVLAVKATPKADGLIKADSRRNHDGNPYAATKLEAVKSCWKCYIPAAATGVATIICIFGANTLNKKQQASLASAYLEYDIEMNSCSTMHKITDKEFTLDDFSHEHLNCEPHHRDWIESATVDEDITSPHKVWMTPLDILRCTIEMLNAYRESYLETKDKQDWWQMIQLLPSSYNQKRTVMLNYEVLANMYKSRRNHKLDEWHTFCDWIESLPYSTLITGGVVDE